MNGIESIVSLSGTLSIPVEKVPEQVTDYNQLENLPTINGVIVKGDMTTGDLKIRKGYDVSVDPEDESHLIFTN